MERECYRAERDHAAFSVCIMDLDFFKAINDTYGHSAGDAVLVETARLLTSSFRKGDVICRYGGEEFAAILHQTDMQKALVACETFRGALERKVVDHDGNSLQVTVSIGIETYDGRLAKTPGELIDQADQALYKAKKAGRNKVVSNTAM
jgi:diguanylate cyclase (GGDEF)-like protein